MKHYVYYLYSPLDPEGVRYVGKTNNPKTRFWCHLSDPKDSLKTDWIKKMGRENVSIYVLSEHATEDECLESEIETIARLRALGCSLINVSNGGEGGRRQPVHIKPFPPMTRETLTKIRDYREFTIGKMADKLGISRNTLAGYEKGVQKIPNYIALAATAIYRRLEAME